MRFAAGAALALVGYNRGYLGNTAAARGWLARAARIIENEVPELRGELLGATAYVTDDPVRSEALARQAAEIGRARGHPDLELMAMHADGQALVQQGQTEEGMSLLAEARAGVIGGEGRDPLTVAQVSCMTGGVTLGEHTVDGPALLRKGVGEEMHVEGDTAPPRRRSGGSLVVDEVLADHLGERDLVVGREDLFQDTPGGGLDVGVGHVVVLVSGCDRSARSSTLRLCSQGGWNCGIPGVHS